MYSKAAECMTTVTVYALITIVHYSDPERPIS